ncbi:MAG: MlaD family protein, partial [Acidimicrobiales bacterium]
MKAFTERNPYIIGGVAIAVILAFTAAGLFLTKSLFTGSYPMSAVFADSAGLRSGDQVMVAGVASGTVTSIKLENGKVRVGLNVNSGIKLPVDSTAAVHVETLLGTKDVK